MYYCLEHKEFVDDNHECDDEYIIWMTENMKCVADRIHAMGLKLLSATCTVEERIAQTGQYIHIDVDLKKYNKLRFPDLPEGWGWYDLVGIRIEKDIWGHERVENGDEYSRICKYKKVNYKDIPKAERKADRIIKEFLDYLNDIDGDALSAVMTLYGD